jgi:hypothetical protein
MTVNHLHLVGTGGALGYRLSRLIFTQSEPHGRSNRPVDDGTNDGSIIWGAEWDT